MRERGERERERERRESTDIFFAGFGAHPLERLRIGCVASFTVRYLNGEMGIRFESRCWSQSKMANQSFKKKMANQKLK